MSGGAHTKGPWRATYQEDHGNHVIETAHGEWREIPIAFTATHFVSGREPANAAFIVRSCNSHYDQLEALERGHAYLRDYCAANGGPDPQDQNVLNAMSAAIAKAKGEA